MEFTEPFKIYTADSNAEAIMIAEMLNSNGVPAFADQDQFWALGMLTQLHRSNVWVEKSTTHKAVELIRRFEQRKWQRTHSGPGTSQIHVQCEECGRISFFPDSLRGTIQDCSHCGAYVDVGELDWETETDDPERKGSP